MYSEEYHCPLCSAPVNWNTYCDPREGVIITFFCVYSGCYWLYRTPLNAATPPFAPPWLDQALTAFRESRGQQKAATLL